MNSVLWLWGDTKFAKSATVVNCVEENFCLLFFPIDYCN